METLIKLRPSDKIVIHSLPVMEKTDMANLHTYLIENPKSILVVTKYDVGLMNTFLEEVDAINSGYIFFQIELDIDPINNNLVPIHRQATIKEIECLKKKKIPLDKLPVLKMKDPIRRWYNFSVESIIAIERNDGMYFRICK